MDYTAWTEDLIGEDTRREASKKAGMSESTLSRQLSRNSLSPEMVIALCRAYNRKPVDGLLQTGYLHPWEAEGISVDAALDQASNRELLGAVMRRSDPDALYLFGRTDDLINPDIDVDGTVVPFPGDQTEDSQEDPEQEYEDLGYVADGTDTEPEEGDDDYSDGA